MAGTVISAALQIAGGIAGSIIQQKAMQEMKAKREKYKNQLTSEYNRKYNEDPLQRADTQRLLTKTFESIKNRNTQAAAQQAVAGGSEEGVAAAQEANAKSISDTMSNISAQNSARKDSIDTQHHQDMNSLYNEEQQATMNTAQRTAEAVKSMSSAAGNIQSASNTFKDGKENSTKKI